MKAWLAVIAAGLAATGAALADGPAPYVVRSAMQQGINGATMEIWDVGNAAMDEDSGIDPRLIDRAGWARLEAAAARLEAEAERMQRAQAIRAAGPGEAGAVELGSFSLEDVQGYIDADPQAFRDMAGALAGHARDLRQAAHERNAARAGALVSGLDGVCEACHAKYWYPQG
jgi:hypothetical protein